MTMLPFTLIDYTRGLGGFPLVTQGYRYCPEYSARVTDKGADAFLNGEHIASFNTMDEACRFVTEQSNRALPWFMRTDPIPSTGGE